MVHSLFRPYLQQPVLREITTKHNILLEQQCHSPLTKSPGGSAGEVVKALAEQHGLSEAAVKYVVISTTGSAEGMRDYLGEVQGGGLSEEVERISRAGEGLMKRVYARSAEVVWG